MLLISNNNLLILSVCLALPSIILFSSTSIWSLLIVLILATKVSGFVNIRAKNGRQTRTIIFCATKIDALWTNGKTRTRKNENIRLLGHITWRIVYDIVNQWKIKKKYEQRPNTGIKREISSSQKNVISKCQKSEICAFFLTPILFTSTLTLFRSHINSSQKKQSYHYHNPVRWFRFSSFVKLFSHCSHRYLFTIWFDIKLIHTFSLFRHQFHKMMRDKRGFCQEAMCARMCAKKQVSHHYEFHSKHWLNLSACESHVRHFYRWKPFE